VGPLFIEKHSVDCDPDTPPLNANLPIQ